jgi:hypothetical protein
VLKNSPLNSTFIGTWLNESGIYVERLLGSSLEGSWLNESGIYAKWLLGSSLEGQSRVSRRTLCPDTVLFSVHCCQ